MAFVYLFVPYRSRAVRVNSSSSITVQHRQPKRLWLSVEGIFSHCTARCRSSRRTVGGARSRRAAAPAPLRGTVPEISYILEGMICHLCDDNSQFAKCLAWEDRSQDISNLQSFQRCQYKKAASRSPIPQDFWSHHLLPS
jgi:hypothetical protein